MKTFSQISWIDFPKQYFYKIQQEIAGKGKEYLLGVDENEFVDYLYEKYRLEPLNILTETESISEPTKSKERISNHYHDGYYEVEVYTFTVQYEFTGSEELFQILPNPHSYTTYDVKINSPFISFQFKIYKQDVDHFKKAKSNAYHEAFDNLYRVNDNLKEISGNFKATVKLLVNNQKDKYLQENDFFKAINVNINRNTSSVFSAPTITKKIIPQPSVSEKSEFSSEPTMAKEMYNDILKVIYDLGKSMEKKPSTYQNKDEEGLRDQILLVLETRYDGTTATGETFNRGGKTDIILKFAKDSSNLFVAECKFWHGPSEFLKAISQLFDRYLTWRDSKTAIILFVKNKEFSNVLTTARHEIKNHPYYIKENSSRGESSFSYIFHLPNDVNKNVYLEVILFHYDK